MYKYSKKESLSKFQELIQKIYGLPDDRLFSLWDLVSNQERFTMRALKGIRKNDKNKLSKNLLISFSWLMAIANRLHLDVEEETWKRFPARCSYCGTKPCSCKKQKASPKARFIRNINLKPGSLSGFQKMFSDIYPASGRSLSEAGVHLAEEMGELSEAIHCFLGEHKKNQFDQIGIEIADFISCVFGVANSAKIDVAGELAKMYFKNCHVCHEVECRCNFNFVGKYRS
jgi:NTP pyrophosphatase (non-canonical NTP hydrolase)